MAILDNSDLALPQGSLILVTGATGYIAGNIVREALDAGYKVRGTVRTQEKADQTKKTFNNNHYEPVIVPDIQEDGAFDEAVKGADAIIHAASSVTMSPDPHKVIPVAVQGTLGALNSALTEPNVKRVVVTSSSTAATLPKPGEKFRIDKNTWNTEIDHFADKQPPYKEEDGFSVYAVSKLRAEQEVWKFVEEKNPHFVVNCILPNFNMGRIVGNGGMTARFVQDAFRGDVPWDFPPQYMINVVDDARLHVAAAIDGSLSNERIFAFDSPFNWNDVIDVFRELRPDAKLPATRTDQPRDLSEVDNGLGAELLKKWWGQDGYAGLKESVRQLIVDL